MVMHLSIDDDNMDFYSELTLKSSQPDKLKAAFDAIKPETTVIITSRGKCDIEIIDEETLKMYFYATDFISLRAMLGSYLRWLDAALETIQPSKKI